MDSYDVFVELHKTQLESSKVPFHLWESLHHKIENEIFDSGDSLTLMNIDYSDEPEEFLDSIGNDDNPVSVLYTQRSIDATDPLAIYLIDHAFSFQMDAMRKQLGNCKELTDRLCRICGVSIRDPNKKKKLMARIWKYTQAYSIQADRSNHDDSISIWYILDEVGCAIKHCEFPNFRLVPFLYQNTKMTYSLLFPIRDCQEQEEVYCDFLEYVKKESPERSALLLPWKHTDLSSESFIQTEPEASYFTLGHVVETFPVGLLKEPQIYRNQPLKVYTEYRVLREHLTDASFELVDNELEADVLWSMKHFKNFAELSENKPNKFINQFPFEYVITIKDLLSITCRRAAEEHHNAVTLDTYPCWLPTTYNLRTEILEFASYYQNREIKGLDNHWIIKPWNLARGMDTLITNSIEQIMRLPVTGPKIAQKYIERPVLFHREELHAKVKFDIRYVVLLKQINPLEAYVYKKFFLRFSNKPFSMESFDDYEKHFTVMNYIDDAQICHIKCDDFINCWEEQYPAHAWCAVEDSICQMLLEVLKCATKVPPPCGIAQCPQSRALYAADIMLEWVDNEKRMQPKLLEINWSPDCKRACDYYPDFYNNIFKLLFLDENFEDCFRSLASN